MREVALWSPRLGWRTRDDGATMVWREDPLGPYPDRVTERLIHWAGAAPERCFLAQRDAAGEWRRITYADILSRVRRIGQALLDLGLSAERPLLILSGASIEHGLMALGAQHVGIPSAAIAPAYALVSQDFAKLRAVAAQLTPGLLFADAAAPYRPAVAAVFGDEPPLVSADGEGDLNFADLATTEATTAVDAAHRAVGRDTVAKFIFTSGTTGAPKAVVQTHGNITSNQAMVADCYAFVRETPPIIVEWAPWNHVAAGTKVFNLAMFNGGTYHIDEGRPAPGAIEVTIRNIRDVAPTWYFNVPAGYELLVQAMEADERLRDRFFERLQYLMYSGAGLAQRTWDRLAALSERGGGPRVVRSTVLGSTETGPFALCNVSDEPAPGNCGIPAQGVVMKLVPESGRLALRLKSPSITPGYWRNPEQTEAAFDEEGFFRLGDAVRFADPGDPTKGFFFDGRLAENFKLATGTWVAVGPLRARLIDDLGGLARDAVIAGEGRAAPGALLLPFMPALRDLIGGGAPADDAAVLEHPAVTAALRNRLAAHAAGGSGSSTRVTRATWLSAPLSFDRGEVTDKGSVNQRAVLRNQAELVEALYAGGGSGAVSVAG